MKVVSAEFIKSVAHLSQLPKDGLPQIAFAGRSNVGKSSMLNCLLNRKKLVMTSSTPGKTRLLNFFLINNSFYFVDLPGYGYAKVARSVADSWGKLIEQYLMKADALKGVVALTDIRHPIQKNDYQLLDWLSQVELPAIVVATKADKLSNNKGNVQLAKNAKLLNDYGIQQLMPFSSVSGKGKAELWQSIDGMLLL